MMNILSYEVSTQRGQGHPTVRVLVLTSASHESIVREVFAAGAQGYVLKGAAPAALLDAIRAVYRGESPMTPVIREMLDA